MKKHVVQTEALEIVDEQGHVRLRLGISHDQQPFISMLDLSGVVRARFGVQGDGAAGIAIGDENGKIRATSRHRPAPCNQDCNRAAARLQRRCPILSAVTTDRRKTMTTRTSMKRFGYA